MKEFIEKLMENEREKVKVTSLEIIVTGTKDKPYFEIKYKEVGKEDYNIGYGSYDLNNVFGWKNECFEIVNQLAEEYKKTCVEELLEAKKNCGENSDCSKCQFGQIENRCILEELQIKDGNNGWIPCTAVDHPEHCNDCEVTIKDSHGYRRDIAFYTDKWRMASDELPVLVVAWKEPSAPYQPKGEY